MKTAIIKRIEALGTEAGKLMQLRDQHEQAIKDIEIRLHQIAGAITELDAMTKGDKGEIGDNSRKEDSSSSE